MKNQIGLKDIHTWFGLTYASYLTLPRSILQSMPEEWQDKFVNLLEDFEKVAGEYKIRTPRYTVLSRNSQGKFIKDPYRDYERGRRNVFKKGQNA